jgi:glutathione peroxidase
MSSPIYDIAVDDIHGKQHKLDEFKGKVLLIVNVASKCGFTPQYKGLEALYEKMHSRGLEVLGFPCNQFGAQEPGSAEEIESFCELNYGVTFPLFAKVDVNGNSAAPLYRYLKKEQPGLLGSEAIKWNFTKFLVDRERQGGNRAPCAQRRTGTRSPAASKNCSDARVAPCAPRSFRRSPRRPSARRPRLIRARSCASRSTRPRQGLIRRPAATPIRITSTV